MEITGVEDHNTYDDVELKNLYDWVDRILRSVRSGSDGPKRNEKSEKPKSLAQDCSDAVLVAEIVKHYFPKLVQMHNYSHAQNTRKKISNWFLFNRKVLSKLGIEFDSDFLRALANERPNYIEKALMMIRQQIDTHLKQQGRGKQGKDSKTSQQKDGPSEAPKEPAQNKEPSLENPKSNQALVPVKTAINPGANPGVLASPRKYARGEIPHNHPDRSFSYQLSDDNLSMQEARSYSQDRRSQDYDSAHFIYPTSDRVPRRLVEEKELEIMEKDEKIRKLNSVIRRLEQLLQLKDMRISDLQSEIDQEHDSNHTPPPKKTMYKTRKN